MAEGRARRGYSDGAYLQARAHVQGALRTLQQELQLQLAYYHLVLTWAGADLSSQPSPMWQDLAAAWYNGSGHLALQPHGSGSMIVQSDEADSDSEDEEEVGSRQAAADMETTFGENEEEEEEGSELGSEPVQLYAIPPKGRRAALVPACDFQQHVDSAKQELAATADAVPSDEDFLERLAIVKARYCMDATLADGQLAPALLDQLKLSAQQSTFVEVMRCQAEHRVELSSAAANPAKETTKLWRYLAGQPITKADILEYIKLAELALVMTPGSVEEERMFSAMAYLKDDTRNRLQQSI
ncbi:hypothetical protein QJQ45_003138 [Haematococcus lacustris]|nr:hypothetical protein QJQ45_003138 [Haematococcus lacustris]